MFALHCFHLRQVTYNVLSFVIDGYNHHLKAADGSSLAGRFDSICVRDFLTLDASTLTANTNDDILYKIIYEMVIS